MFQHFDDLEKKIQSNKALVFKSSKSFLRKKILFSAVTCLIGTAITLSVSYYYKYFESLWGDSFKSTSSLIVILGAICLFIGIYNTITTRYSIWFFDKEKQTLFLYIRKVLLKIETEIPFKEIEGLIANQKETKGLNSIYHAYLSTIKSNISFNTYNTIEECNEINDCIVAYINQPIEKSTD